MKDFNPQTLDEHILEGMARAIWVNAYAARSDEEQGWPEKDHRLRRAGAGEDWNDVAPSTPLRAYLEARSWMDALVQANRKPELYTACAWQLFGRAMAAEEPGKVKADDYRALNELNEDAGRLNRYMAADAFGHYMAMQMMGHGVSWFDDHAEFPIEIPRRECPDFTQLED